ncbi:uncharacterized protein EAE98_010020 [Botrytis deweyae]|uniref:SMP-LTD domain-containing protein n=1 Tax=Botrytis deweyae TaxID=2478750 RepID=A0ABQ7IAX0_9HELO|nr:uncharacterized protein EAE98_010020 [Botrytis deweyae]KAF7917992.1 hypothetical protein EAE98_010020 [Botrytis deweyae]
MFRLIKPRLTSTWTTNVRARSGPGRFAVNPLSMRSNAPRYAGTASNPHVVRFRKSPIRMRNVAISFMVVYVCFEVYTRLVLGPLDKAAEEASKHIPEEEWQEAEPPLFIPFPGTAKQLPTIPYKGTDPEFQEFIKISQDTKLMNKIRADLADMMRDLACNSLIAVLIGKNLKSRRIWLDIDFPSIPPPSFERSGIEISDDAISWVTQPVDHRLVYKIRNVLWPTVVFQSSWSFIKVLAAEELRNIAGILGLGVQTSPDEQSVEQILTLQRTMKGLKGQQKVPGGVQGPLDAKDEPSQQHLDDKSKEIRDITGPGKSTVKEEIFPALVNNIRDIHAGFAKPFMAFKYKYVEASRLWPTQNLHPRGSIKVSGFVELESDRAFVVFDVIAAWDPKKKEFDAASMQVKMRRVQRKKQRPIGLPRGPVS